MRPPATTKAQPSPLLIGPDSAEAGPRALRVGDDWCQTFAVTGYPREVRPGWLDPLVRAPGLIDVALHVEPLAQTLAADRMRRQRARLESSRRSDAARGRLTDPELDVAAADAEDLAERIARGDCRLFRVGLYVTVHAKTREDLTLTCSRVHDLAASLLIDLKPTTFRTLQGWLTTLPLGTDAIRMSRTFDTEALAAAFPFSASEVECHSREAILYGLRTTGDGVVTWDRFAQSNHNAVILARSGAGKSYLSKLELLRSLYQGIDVAVVDPENEYGRLADAVGGVTLGIGAGGVRINPFDLGREPDALTTRALFIHTLISVLLRAAPTAEERAALDRAIIAAYRERGITSDTETHKRSVPVLTDLNVALRQGGAVGTALAGKLEPFISGTHRHLFDGPTTLRPTGHLVVYALRALADEVRPAAMLLVLDALWRGVRDGERKRRMCLVDEAWLVMRDAEGARFLFRLAKSARKYWCGLTVVTQDAADLLGSDLGQAVVANAATQVLLRQSPQAIDAIGDAFRLSDGERRFLLTARQGEGILIGGEANDRVAFRAVASSVEHRLVTSDPAELAGLEVASASEEG